MDLATIHPVLGWLLVLCTLVQTVIIYTYFISDIARDVACWRRKGEQRAIAFHDAVIRYLTIPYLACLCPALILQFLFNADPVSFWDYLSAACQVFVGHVMWKKFKNRKRKHKIKEKVLAKIEQVEGKLVVVPVKS